MNSDSVTRSRSHFAAHSTVGEICHQDFFTIAIGATVADAINEVRRLGQRGNIFYIYVVSSEERLVGIVSIRNLLVAKDSERISDVYSSGVVFLPESAAIPEAYRLFSQSRFLSLPVVDGGGKLRGVVHAHELIQEYQKQPEELFEERTRGELFELLGIKAEDATSGIVRTASGRLPWLVVNILGGALSAYFIQTLGGKLKDAVAFLAFLPILLVVSESIGMQTASVVIANLHRSKGGSPARKEMGVALILAVICALLVAVPVFFLKGALVLSIAIGLTIFIGTLYVSSLGTALPLLIHELHVDPRIAVGPLVLAAADCGTLALYLILSLWLTR